MEEEPKPRKPWYRKTLVAMAPALVCLGILLWIGPSLWYGERETGETRMLVKRASWLPGPTLVLLSACYQCEKGAHDECSHPTSVTWRRALRGRPDPDDNWTFYEPYKTKRWWSPFGNSHESLSLYDDEPCACKRDGHTPE